MSVDREPGYWWLRRPENQNKWQIILVVDNGDPRRFGLLPGVAGTATLHDGDSFGWEWGDYLGTEPGQVHLLPIDPNLEGADGSPWDPKSRG